MTIEEAIKSGISRIRKPVWADPRDHIQLDVFEKDGMKYFTPWAKLVSPMMAEDGHAELAEQPLLVFTDKADDWVEWTQPD